MEAIKHNVELNLPIISVIVITRAQLVTSPEMFEGQPLGLGYNPSHMTKPCPLLQCLREDLERTFPHQMWRIP